MMSKKIMPAYSENPLMVRIQELPDSNLGPEIDYPDSGLSWFASVLPGECRESILKLGHDRFISNNFQFINH
jgi:hypothetical protein